MFLLLYLAAFIKVAEPNEKHWGFRNFYNSTSEGVQCFYSRENATKPTELISILISSSKDFKQKSYKTESATCPKDSSWTTTDIKPQIVQDYTDSDVSETDWPPLVTDCMDWTAHEPQTSYIIYPGNKYCSVFSQFGTLTSHLAVDGKIFHITAYHQHRIYIVEIKEFDWYRPKKAYHLCSLNGDLLEYDNNGTARFQECIPDVSTIKFKNSSENLLII